MSGTLRAYLTTEYPTREKFSEYITQASTEMSGRLNELGDEIKRRGGKVKLCVHNHHERDEWEFELTACNVVVRGRDPVKTRACVKAFSQMADILIDSHKNDA